MSTIESVLIPNPGKTATPFWPSSRSRLVIIFEILDDKVIAHVLDPDSDKIQFKATLRRDQQTAFSAAVTAGEEGTLIEASASNHNLALDANTVVIGGTGDDGPGPKFVVQYALILPGAQLAPATTRATGT